MDFGTTLSYLSFYLVSLVIAYYYFTTRNKERMALIEAGANPDMFNSREKYYILFVIGVVAMGIAIGVMLGVLLNSMMPNTNRSILFLSSMLLCGGGAMLIAFFTIIRWLKN